MHKPLLQIVMMVMLALASSVGAEIELDEDPGHDAPKREKKLRAGKKQANLKEVVLRGRIVKEDVERKGKMITVYQLKDGTGMTVRMPRSKDIDLAAFVDRNVVVTGMGTERTRKDKKVVMLKTVTDVRPLDGEDETFDEPMENDEFMEDEHGV